MTSAHRRPSMWALAAALGAALGVGAAWAQDAARSLADAQAAALKAGPTTAPRAGSVPGFAGDAPGLQGLAGDADGLSSAGAAAAASGSPGYALTQGSLAARTQAGVDPTAGWLAAARDAHANPMGLVNAGDADVTGAESRSCREETQTESHTAHTLYSCETSTAVSVNRPACAETYRPEVTDTTAVCTETWNGATFIASDGCAAGGDRNCHGGPRTCVTPSTPVHAPYACQEGYVESTATTVSPYDCQSGYVESTSTSTSSYDCSEGYISGSSTASCGGSITPNIQYGTIAGPCALPSPLFPYDQCAGAWHMPKPGCVVVDELYDAAGGHWVTFACDPYDAGDSYADSCSGMSGCSQVATTCTLGPATYSYEGVPVYRDCWAWSYTYSCPGGRTEAPGCSPPPGAALTGSDCSGRDASGACTQWDRHYSVTSTSTTATPSPGCFPSGSCGLVSQDCAAYNAVGVCTAVNQHYTCTETQTQRTPASGCSPGAGCSQTGATCSAYDASGRCTQVDRTFACVSDPAGGCFAWRTDYACRSVTGSAWEAEGACNPTSDPICSVASVTCLEGAATRLIDGAYVDAACWRRETTYECVSRTTTDNCHPEANCIKTSDQCLDDPNGPFGCLTEDHQYDCAATTTTSTTVNRCEDRLCLGDSCFSLSREADGDFAQVYSQLAAMQQAGHDYGSNPDFTIFKGKALKCHKAVLGFANCCKDSGWGLSLGLAHCSEDERQLITEQEKTATHYVGTYCSDKSVFGVCLEKKMSYCGFGAPLPRIVNEAGRSQIGKGWGTVKTPDCTGFTIDQFQGLDLSAVDFSDFYRETLDGLASPDPTATTSRIQQSIEALYGAGAPRSGPL